jgi:integrase
MSKIKLPFVQQWVDHRHGGIRVRYYFRRRGFKRVALPGPPGSAQFMEAYQAAMGREAVRPEIGRARTKPGTIADLVAKYLSSAAFLSRKPLTQSTYRNILERFRREHGDKRVAIIEQRHIQAMQADKVSTPAAANHWLRLMKALFKLAVTEGMRHDNPAAQVERVKVPKGNAVEDGFRTWSEHEIEAFEAHHPIGSTARLAFALMLYTATRVSDAVKIGRGHLLRHVKTGRRMIKIRQQKTGQYVAIPLHPKLAAVLDALPAGRLTFILNEYGRAFSAKGLGNKMRDWCDQAGLPECTSHGLRKACCRRLAEAGCSEKQIASISGHTDMRVVALYVKMADQARMAIDATDKLVALFDRPNAVVEAADLAAETVVEGTESEQQVSTVA